MELTVTASGQFSSSHEVPGHPKCGHLHGHRWGVSVTIGGGIDPAYGYMPKADKLADEVAQFCSELDYEDLALMLPASPPTPEGLAYALHERLAMDHTIIEVTVTMDDKLAATLK